MIAIRAWRDTLARMIAARVVLSGVVLAACGRISFDATATMGDGDAGQGNGDGASGNGDGAASIVPSCAGAASICGAAGDQPCCTTIDVVGGAFIRFFDVGTDGAYPDTTYGATVSSFKLDKYEVTVGRFRAFVAAGAGTQANLPTPGAGAHPLIANSGWVTGFDQYLPLDTTALLDSITCNAITQTWTATPGSREAVPINCVTWFVAFAFCAWDGGRLPTEAEWNYAAAAGSEQRAFPWSAPASDVVIDASRGSYFNGICNGDGLSGCGIDDLLLVGSRPAGDSAYGHADMDGNVAEWTLDYLIIPPPNPCIDCANISAGANRGLRGGGYVDDQTKLRSGNRGAQGPSQTIDSIGFRCARD